MASELITPNHRSRFREPVSPVRTAEYANRLMVEGLHRKMSRGLFVAFGVDGLVFHNHYIPPENIVLDGRGLSVVGASKRIFFVADNPDLHGIMEVGYFSADDITHLLIGPSAAIIGGGEVTLDPVLELFYAATPAFFDAPGW